MALHRGDLRVVERIFFVRGCCTAFLESRDFKSYEYHLLQNNYSFDALQAYCFRINMQPY